jgi:molybdopterin synthase catalytic subunit
MELRIRFRKARAVNVVQIRRTAMVVVVMGDWRRRCLDAPEAVVNAIKVKGGLDRAADRRCSK